MAFHYTYHNLQTNMLPSFTYA